MSSNSGIYIIKNTINGHLYVGSSVNMIRRWTTHKCNLNHNRHSNVRLQSAWNEFGANFFTFEIFESDIPPVDLLPWEQATFEYYNPEYNICQLAGHTLGYKHSPESLEKMSKWQKGFSKSFSSVRQKSRSQMWMGKNNPNFQRNFTAEHREKIGKSRKGKPFNCKLNKEDIIKIKELSKTLKVSEIALIFNVVDSTIYRILSGLTWK